MTDKPVTLAVVIGAHGVTGEVRLKFFTGDLTPYRSFNDGALTLKSLRGQIARFAEVADRNAAEALRGTALTVPRSLLPPLGEGEYYHADLVDLPCLVDGAEIGRVFAICVLGGMGSFAGTLVAAMALGIVESITATFYGPSWAPAVSFGFLLVTLAVRPAGIFGR